MEEQKICEVCNIQFNKNSNYLRHLTTIKHNEKINNKQKNKYVCNKCNFTCSKKSNYNVHILSSKHLISNDKNNDAKNKNILELELFKNEIMTKFNIMEEQNKVLIEMASSHTPSTIIQNNNVSNQQFNMNVFLNETCKDAMNMSEFIDNLQVSMEDMEKTGELGFAKGMSRIIMNNLNAIDVCKRPIHCSDVKRETLYVKNNGVWEKETEDRKKTKEVIYKISCLNVKQLLKWRDLPRNKGYEKSDHTKNDEFTKLVMEIHKLREEEINKVITNISKYVAIDKVKMSGYLN